MDRSRYAELRRVFEQVESASSSERIARLDQLCSSDPELRREVEALLEASPAATTAIVRMASPFDTDPPGSGDRRGFKDLPLDLGPYRIEEEIGRGGMGIVYAAVDTRLERRVALKLLPEDIFSIENAAESFKHEARLLAALDHVNVATIFSLETIDTYTFYTLGLLDGEPLIERLRRGPVGRTDTLRIAHQLAQALAAAHAQEIVHLDLKPGNLMVLPNGRLKVLDFGIARTFAQLAEAAGSTGFIAGTPGYMSPEQLAGNGVNARSDIFSFGAILYECIVGSPPFGRASTAILIDRTLSSEPDWSKLPEDLPEEWDELLRSCLKVDPDQRPAGAIALRRRIDQLIAGELLPPTMPGPEIGTFDTPHNLPPRLTPMFGRDANLTALLDDLHAGTWTTVTGVGGSGKTRLALEAAKGVLDRFEDGVFWISVEARQDAAQIDHAIAATCGFGIGTQVVARSALLDKLSDRAMLLLLDYADAARDDTRQLAEDLLARCPKIAVLVTSTAPLESDVERVHLLGPLECPDASASESEVSTRWILDSPAGQLFATRAERYGFKLTGENARTVAEIARRLDGIPLALELAAGRLEVLDLEDLRARLDDRFQLLGDGRAASLPQSRTLRATLDWSHQLLSDDEKILFRRLALFADGWTLQAAEAVCAYSEIDTWSILDLLSSLIRKSLVTFSHEGPRPLGGRRYRFLETIRAFAVDKLNTDEAEIELGYTHLVQFYCELMEESETHLDDHEQATWLSRIDAEQANFQHVLFVSSTRPKCVTPALRACNSAWMYWDRRGDFRRGRAWVKALLAAALPDTDSRDLARALNTVASFSQELGDYEEARAAFREAIQHCRKYDTGSGVPMALMNLAILEKRLSNYDDARELYLEALARTRDGGQRRNLLKVLLNLGILENEVGRRDESMEYLKESLEIAEDLNDPHALATIYNTVALQLLNQGREALAREYLERSIALYLEVGDATGSATPLVNLGIIYSEAEDHEEARQHFERALQLRLAAGYAHGITVCRVNLVPSLTKLERLEEARDQLDTLRRELKESPNRRIIAYTLEAAARLVFREGDALLAIRLEGAAEQLRTQAGVPLSPIAEEARKQRFVDYQSEVEPARFAELLEEGRGWEYFSAMDGADRPGGIWSPNEKPLH